MNKKYEMIKTMIAATNGGQTTLVCSNCFSKNFAMTVNQCELPIKEANDD